MRAVCAVLLFTCAIAHPAHAQGDPSYFDSVLVADISIDGNDSFADDVLMLKLRTREAPAWLWRSLYVSLGARFPGAQEPEYFDFQSFRDDIDALTIFYRNNGFFHARVDGSYEREEDGSSVAVLFTIDEGPPSLIDSVALRNIGGLPDDVRQRIAEDGLLVPGKRYRAEDVEAEKNRILTLLRDNGFPRGTADTVLVERKL